MNYLWHESFAVVAAPVTNNVATGCAPTVTNCTVPDSATDDHVRVTIDTCASSPVLPATGVTGFTFSEQDAGTKVCSSFARVGSTDQLDCDTTAIAAGKTVSWSYGSGVAAAPTTAEFDNCNRTENPLSTGWSGSVDGGLSSFLFSANGSSCGKGGTEGERGSSYRTVALSGDSEISVIFSDAEGADGTTLEIWPAAESPGAGVDGYLCRFTSGATDTIGLYRVDNGTPTLLTSAGHELNNNQGMQCRRQGTSLTVQVYDGANWTQVLSHTDGTYTAASRHLAISGNTAQLLVTSLTGGVLTGGGTGNVTNTAGVPMGSASGSCTNQVASPPAAPVLQLLRVTDTNDQQILATFDPLGGTMTLNGGGCNGFSCKQNGAPWTLASCAVTTSPAIALNTTSAMSAAHTYTCSYAPASGNVTNGTTEIAAFTDSPVDNDLTPVALVRTQHSVRLHQANEPGGLAANSPHWLGPANTGVAVMPGGFVVLLAGVAYTGDASPAEGLAFRCTDNGGAPYEPQEAYGGNLLRFQLSPTLPHLLSLDTRLLANPGGGSTYVPGVLLTQPGAAPARVYDENTDTTLGAVFQVRGTTVAGDTMACAVVTDDGTALNTYTPATTMPIIRVDPTKASGM